MADVQVIKAIIAPADNPKDRWEEDHVVPVSILDAAAYIKEIVDTFNAEEEARHASRPSYPVHKRVFIGLADVKNETRPDLCDWEKQNMITIMDPKTYASWDIIKCTRCGQVQKRYGLSGNPRTECHPERTCKTCGKVYKTKDGYIKHNAKVHNKEIDAYDD